MYMNIRISVQVIFAPVLLVVGSAEMGSDIAARSSQSSAAQPAQPLQPELRRARSGVSQLSSAAQPACCGSSLAHMFLAALDEAAYEREDPEQADLLRELVSSLSLGRLVLLPTDEVWHLDEDEREDFAMERLGQLIELVSRIRTAWLASLERAHGREVAWRCLGPLEGDMFEGELLAAAWPVLMSMSGAERAEYDFCFYKFGRKRFFFALMRQPSVLKGKGLENLLEVWFSIKVSTEYNEVAKELKQCREELSKQETVLQNLRMEINRAFRRGEDREGLVLELLEKEKSYERGRKHALFDRMAESAR